MPGLGEFAWTPAKETKMPFNPFSALTSKIFAGTSLALLLALAFAFMWGKAGWRDAASYKLAAETLKKSYVAAQAAAEAEQKAYYASISARVSDKARIADHENQIKQDRARIASDSYALRMRINALCVPGQTSVGAEDRPPEDRDGPGAKTEYVAVTKNDFDLMVANSVRLEEVRRWGDSLIADGLAIPDTAFGAE